MRGVGVVAFKTIQTLKEVVDVFVTDVDAGGGGGRGWLGVGVGLLDTW